MMRYVYATLIAVLIVIVVMFSLQNVSSVTIAFLTMSATLPLALLVVLVYLAGVFTGGSAIALLRSWIQGAQRK
jgi:putative membrane protein